MRATSVLAAAVVLASLAAPSLALNPLDNDAGSGRDAGDFPTVAVPVAPGTHRGLLAWPHDSVDYYAFEGHEGDWVHFVVSSERLVFVHLYGPDHGALEPGLPHNGGPPDDPATTLLTQDGRWIFEVRLLDVPLGTSVEYELTFSFSRPAQSIILGAPEAWQTVEIVLEGPTRFVRSVRIEVLAERGPRGPQAALVSEEVDLQLLGQRFRGTGYGFFGSSGYGEAVAVYPTGLEVPVEWPEAPPLPFQTSGPAGMSDNLDFLSHDVLAEGMLRLSSVRTPEFGTRFVFSADRPFHVRTASGNDRVSWWSEATSDDAVGVVTPGASALLGRTFQLDVQTHTIGVFTPWLFEGSVTSPSGSTTAMDWFDRAFFVPSDGTWVFELKASTGAGGASAFPYLLAAEVPVLGLVPAWRDGLWILPGPELKGLVPLPP